MRTKLYIYIFIMTFPSFLFGFLFASSIFSMYILLL